MKITNFENLIYCFSKENLEIILGYRIEVKRQSNYLFNYLNHLNCKTIIVEERYTDKYYLDDYLHFYATCHNRYSNLCKRVHFFSEDIKPQDFLSFNKDQEVKLKKIYLGFFVLKPISASIGRTLISIYPNTNENLFIGNTTEQRNILTLRKYEVNLIGYDLTIKSIPFQEQDQVISACATTALWSVLEKTSADYGYYCPTPFEITQSASKNYTDNRQFPSSGLNLLQMINAIRDFGMEVEVGDIRGKKEKGLLLEGFLSECYAYLRGGFPILLGVKIEKEFHAVAILGYNLDKEKPQNVYLQLIGNRINKFYIHDDNLGPFSKYSIVFNALENEIYLECSDRVDQNGDNIKIIPENYIIPLYHKIRYPYSEIILSLKQFLNFFKNIEQSGKGNWEWDCYLISVNNLKKSILLNEYYPEIIKKDILFDFCPRFIWRCTLLYEEAAVVDIFGDATEAKTKIPFFKLIIYSDSLTKVISEMQDFEKYRNIFTNPSLFDFISQQLSSGV